MDNELLVQAFQSDDNIQAIGEGKDGKTIVFVLDDTPELVAPCRALSDNIEFIKVSGFGVGPPYWNEVVEPNTYKSRMRPVPGGPSVGNWRISAGTVSCFVKDNASNDLALLSNWHVLSGESGQIGDEILQPGSADGGTRSNDVVANLRRSVPVNSGLSVFVDCAIAGMKDPNNVDENIIALGKPHGVGKPYIGQWLKKSGRSSETTAGGVAVINASVKVNYGTFQKTIQDCIITGVPSAPGDSGSAMLDFATNAVVALLFAGGTTSDGYLITVGCRADRVEKELNVTFPIPDPIQRRGGIDVSKWQGEMDWNTAKNTGISTAIIRAGSIDNTTGIPYEDSQFRRNAELAPPLMPVGYYWYFRPNHSHATQADYFCDLLTDVDWKVPPVIDIEENAGMSKAAIAVAVWSFAEQIEQSLGVRPIIYTSAGFWNTYVGPTTWAKNYPLWVANWVNIGALTPLVPDDWKGITPVMWQYRVFRGGGLMFGADSTDIDLDTTYKGYEDLINGSEPPPPPGKVKLVVNVVGSGAVSPNSGEYDLGTSVTLTATPADGWKFLHWEGSVVGSDNPIVVVMNSDKNITAVFEEVDDGGLAVGEHNLGVTTVDGLRIRSDAGTDKTVVGVLPINQQVEIMESKKDKFGNDWVRIGYKQWSAQFYQGKEFIHYLLKKFL